MTDAPAATISGVGALRRLPGLLRAKGVRSCLVVTGGQAYHASGAAEIEQLLEGLGVVRLSGVRPNPGSADLAAGVTVLRESDVDAVIGVGGGSVMDYAKAIAALAAQDGPPDAWLRTPAEALREPRRQLLVLIPTTAGTGSEVTSICVLTVDGRKRSIHHPMLRADIALVDPALTVSMSPRTTATTGADALSQAIESYWSTRSTELSRAYAREAMTLAFTSLRKATVDGDLASRTAMSRAATLSGAAIEITQTTAPHALSYLLTTRFGVPHGHACGVFLGPLLAYNAEVGPQDVTDGRGARFVRRRLAEIERCFAAPDAETCARAVDELLHGIDLPTELSAFGVRPQDVGALVEAALRSPRMAGNPRAVPRRALHDLVEARL